MFVDLHCHILPCVDDGADSLNEACELILQAQKCGTTVMAATPHYNNRNRCKRRLNKSYVKTAFYDLKEEVKRRGIDVSLYLGSELLATENIERLNRDDELITLNNSRYILVEFDFGEKKEFVIETIKKLFSYGLVPIIAHPERYDFLRNEPYIICDLLNYGCKVQINKGSPLGNYGEHAKKYSKWLLDNDFVHVIASDCHSVSFRDADMQGIYEWLLLNYPKDKIIKLMHGNPKKILMDSDI